MRPLSARIEASYPVAVARRFFELELLDKSFALAAQTFIALLPLVIVLVSVFTSSGSDVVADQIIERFGLAGAASVAVRSLFGTPDAESAVSWLAILISLISAFSLSRRLSRTYAGIFRLPQLPARQYWRAVLWIAVQVTLLIGGSLLRDVARGESLLITIVGAIALLALWVAGDIASYRLLVPTLSKAVMVPSVALTVVGRIGLLVWASIYMPATLSNQAVQFGPIGVAFALFTYFLVAIFILLIAPLLVMVWRDRRGVGPAPRTAVAGD